VLVYYGSASGLDYERFWPAESGSRYARLGFSVGTAGDVNGDGYADVIVGAPGYDGGYMDEGRVYVYYGLSDGLSITRTWTVEGGQAYASLGLAVGTAGDVDGDGYADIIIGSCRSDG